jgi:RNA-binding protein NOB1
MGASNLRPSCKHLVLDAGPLLSFSPLRNLAQNYYIVPQVISELKDPRAKQHFESLALNAGIRIQVRDPSPSSIAHSQCVFDLIRRMQELMNDFSYYHCEEDGRL